MSRRHRMSKTLALVHPLRGGRSLRRGPQPADRGYVGGGLGGRAARAGQRMCQHDALPMDAVGCQPEGKARHHVMVAPMQESIMPYHEPGADSQPANARSRAGVIPVPGFCGASAAGGGARKPSEPRRESCDRVRRSSTPQPGRCPSATGHHWSGQRSTCHRRRSQWSRRWRSWARRPPPRPLSRRS